MQLILPASSQTSASQLNVGYVDYTRFLFDSTVWIPGSAVTAATWYFGDGIFGYGDSSSTGGLSSYHVYDTAGYYTVTGMFSLSTTTVSLTTMAFVQFPVKTAMRLQSMADVNSTIVSIPGPAPFVIAISSGYPGDNYIDLYAQCSDSIPYLSAYQNRWSHLKPQWYFTDLSGNKIDRVKADGEAVSLYDSVTGTDYGDVGFIGTASFYYVDDRYTDIHQPVILWCTLNSQDMPQVYLDGTTGTIREVASNTNSKVALGIPHLVTQSEPESLEITRDGKMEIFNPQWKDANIYYTITINASASGTDIRGPILLDYPQSNIYAWVSSSVLDRNLLSSSTISVSHYLDPTTQRFSATDAQGFPYGGFVRGSVVPYSTSLNATITASMDLTYDQYTVIPPYVWVSNPENRTINRIFYPNWDTTTECYRKALSAPGHFLEMVEMLYDAPIVTLVPYITADPMALTGFAGIYGIAQNPDRSIWCTDAENDAIYKYSSQGVLLSTIELCFEDRVPISMGFSPTAYTSMVSSGGLVEVDDVSLSVGWDWSLPAGGVLDITYEYLNASKGQYLLNFDVRANGDKTYSVSLYSLAGGTELSSAGPLNCATDNVPFTFDYNEMGGIGFGIRFSLYAIRPVASGPPPCYPHYGTCTLYNITLDYMACPASYTPAGISLDGDENFWVSLFDSLSVLKYDKNGTLLDRRVPSGTNVSELTSFDYFIKPPQVETDTDNNVWVSYANPVSSMLVKFLSGSDLIVDLVPTFGLSSTPIDLVVDSRDNSVWATLTYSNWDGGVVAHFDTNGVLLASASYWQPGYISLDKDRNVWFTYDYNKVAQISSTGGFMFSATVPDTPVPPSGWFDPTERLDLQALEGLGVDVHNRVWVINSLANQVWVLSATVPTVNKAFKIIWDDNLMWYNDLGYIYTMYSEWAKSAQAFGDFTGYRWLQKYSTLSADYATSVTVSAHLTGSSQEFDIKDFYQQYGIRRMNESWDASLAIQDQVINPPFQENAVLWNNLIGQSLGTAADEYTETLGRQTYEKTANFEPNHMDVDTANITQLYSLANMTGVPIDNYLFSYPPELRRMMDILSVHHHKLWGAREKCQRNFYYTYSPSATFLCQNCNHEHESNRGPQLDANTYELSAGVPVVYVDKMSNKGDLLVTTTNVMLTALTGTELLTPYFLYYDFFEFMPGFSNTQVEGVIQWDDDYTTLSESDSSIDEWYKDGGIAEQMLTYILYKGLDLLGS